MEQKNDIAYFSIHMGIYPRTLFIIKGKDKRKVIQDSFMDRNDNDLIFDEDTTTDACTWKVIERNSNTHGFLVWLYNNINTDVIAHESTHVAFETFRDIGGIADEDNQDPFAYLVGWIANRLFEALNYKEHKK